MCSSDLDARSCVDRLRSIEPDLIIIDEVLSQEQELVKSLRLTKGLENVSIIVLGDIAEDNGQKKKLMRNFCEKSFNCG